MSCSHTTQRIQPGVTYQGVASVFECPWCKCDALAAELADQVRVTEEHQRLRYQCETRNGKLEAALRDCVDADSEPYGGSVRAEAIYRARQALEPT